MLISPGSHSSPCSTREFPHTLMFLSLKQEVALERSRFTMERLLQLEKSCADELPSVLSQTEHCSCEGQEAHTPCC